MRQRSSQPTGPVADFLAAQESKGLLRFITCGSVDDGKSTLIGRLLYESKQIFDDQLATLSQDSERVGTQGGNLDFALLTDGLQAEREQGITIDVAYRFFSTDRRTFIVADTPGHEQYTRNMVTGASTADLAIVLIDARKGVLTQTRRHSFLVHLLGITNVIVAVNKIDLVDYDSTIFQDIETSYREFSQEFGFTNLSFVPVSALNGDNITTASAAMPWYHGPTLLSILEETEAHAQSHDKPFRMYVQSVSRPHQDFRGYLGFVASGSLSVGDSVQVQPSGKISRVASLPSFDGDRQRVVAGESIQIVLDDEIDISRGDLLCAPESVPDVGNQFEAFMVWTDENQMMPHRSYLLKIGTKTVGVMIDKPKYKINVNTLEHLAASTLELNDIAICNLATDRPVAYDPYVNNRYSGSFIIIDRITSKTVGAGMIRHSLRRDSNISWQHTSIERHHREELNHQRSATVWFTGLSGSGKSTLANALEVRLHAMGLRTYLLDGDNLRHGLTRDLGFTTADRIENLRRASHVAQILNNAGVIVLACFISPFESERTSAKEVIGEDNFIEVFVDAPLAVTEKRDPKGLYKKARAGELPNFTGIDSDYEPPTSPSIHIRTDELEIDASVDAILQHLRNLLLLP
ncbi:MAG: sulfate adenylyltransferase subunit CysN [Ilumatobacteraceae bacterium]|nr:sulfate adenylyltransferase subunit CysN [Ilumatobacteraceae bacterium]